MTFFLPFWGPNTCGGCWYVALSLSVIDLPTFTHAYYIHMFNHTGSATLQC